MADFMISKEACEHMGAGKVCSYCGDPVVPIRTVDNIGNPTYWPGCESCHVASVFLGVQPWVYKSAVGMVDGLGFKPYGYEVERKSQISKTCSLVIQFYSVISSILEEMECE